MVKSILSQKIFFNLKIAKRSLRIYMGKHSENPMHSAVWPMNTSSGMEDS